MTSPAPDAQSRCLYDILNVPRDATPDAIRSSYRRLALQLHPDKLASSSVSPESATAAFQSLLNAYQVLSDPRERSYYDSHRSQILFSNPTGKGSSRSSFDLDLDLFSFFSSSAFSGFSDTGKGFYKVYSDVFDKVYETEVRFAKAMGMPVDSVPRPPLMGNLESPYEQVTAFYSYWMRFLTVLDFAWVDKYDAASGMNRRDRRLMEEENKKLRKKAKREYNDSVRGLAAFVKKRDKRVVDMAAKRSAEEERRRAEEKERKKEIERRRMEQAKLYKEQEWAEVEEVEEVEEVVDESHDDDKKSRELYCVVCSKKFKSEKQWKNHEQSRKHRDKVMELRESLLEEGTSEEEDGFQDEVQVGFDYVPVVDKEDDIVDGLCEEFDNMVEVETEKGGVLPSQDKELGLSVDEEDSVLSSKKKEPELSVDEEEDVLEAMMSGLRNRSAGNLDQSDISSSKGLGVDSEEEANAKYDSGKKVRKNKPRRRAKGKTNKENLKKQTSHGTEDVSYANHQVEDDENVAESSDCVQEAETNAKLGNGKGNNQQPKKKQNEGKAAVKKEKDPFPNNRSKGKKQKGESKAFNNACGTCGESFESRNKLFVHLGETGHVTLKSR